MNSQKTIRDAVHGDIDLTHGVMELIDTPEFQRMRGIKQLGTSSLIFPSAVHTRFEHSLGTCFMAKKILKHLRITMGDNKLLQEEEALLFYSALLHDITHIPFGHTFEDERRIFPRHDECSKRLDFFIGDSSIGKVLENRGIKKGVYEILGQAEPTSKNNSIIRQIISGTVCADMLDYLKRDAYFCGLKLDFDERIFRSMTLFNDDVGFNLFSKKTFRQDGMSELIHLLRIRYTLSERVYYHHAKMVSGAMISKALEIALAEGTMSLDTILMLRDDVFIDRLKTSHPRSAKIVDDLLSHQFYSCIYILRNEDFEGEGASLNKNKLIESFHLNKMSQRALAEEELSKELALTSDELIIYCPSDKMAAKEAKFKVKMDEGPAVFLSEKGLPEIEVLKSKHRALWNLKVYVKKNKLAKVTHAKQRCYEFFSR